MRVWLALLVTLHWAQSAAAERCKTERFEDIGFTWCRIDLAKEQLRLWLYGPDGLPYGSFDRLNGTLAEDGKTLGIAMNAGMYHRDRAPVGHYVENGSEVARLITSEGPGNFGLLPNGVLCLQGDRAEVIESRAFAATAPGCAFATQSGPMLLIEGALHPRFLPKSDSRHIRNGVGVRAGGREVVLVIAEDPVNFHRFARFFRDRLGVRDALFLDGTVSKLFAPELGRNDVGLPMGPILGTVAPSQ